MISNNKGTMEELIRKKCKEAEVAPDELSKEERARLIEEIKAEQQGYEILDGVLSSRNKKKKKLM